MTHQLVIENIRKIRKAIPEIESKIKVKISFKGNVVFIKGSELNEFIVEKILTAIDFGFDVEDALILANKDFNLEFINIKDHTPRKNLTDVRARLIGKSGKAKRTIETLTGGLIVVNSNMVGLIIDSEHLSAGIQGIISLIQGSKHGNVFSYLEKQNANLNSMKLNSEDLGLRNPEKDLGNL